MTPSHTTDLSNEKSGWDRSNQWIDVSMQLPTPVEFLSKEGSSKLPSFQTIWYWRTWSRVFRAGHTWKGTAAKTGDTQKPLGCVFYTKDKSPIVYGFDLNQQIGVKRTSVFQA
jgi:hypothetical protein